MDKSEGNQSIPEVLYHTTLTVVEYHRHSCGSTRDVYALGTHTTMPAAKESAHSALEHLGYQADDFLDYAARLETPSEQWKHGDAVLVYAKDPRGREFLVGIGTAPNTDSLEAGTGDKVLLPEGHDHLHYVMKRMINYSQDRCGAFHTCEILGCYLKRDDALVAAKAALDADHVEYAQYDERKDGEADGGWPFGEEVVVHAVGQTGENYTVAVTTVQTARNKHGKAQRSKAKSAGPGSK
ncbi:hypothetical protein VTK26DRAFT_5031 [Humicola hyalothermophila]